MKKKLLEDIQYTPSEFDFEEKKSHSKKHKKDEKDSKKKHHSKAKSLNDNGHGDENDKEKSEDEKRRINQIEEFFKQPGVNVAQYAYRLFDVKVVEGKDTDDMKNARSLFMKKLYHEENEDGYPYSFDSDELIKLEGLISSNMSKVETNESKVNSFFNTIIEGYEKYGKKLQIL